MKDIFNHEFTKQDFFHGGLCAVNGHVGTNFHCDGNSLRREKVIQIEELYPDDQCTVYLPTGNTQNYPVLSIYTRH